MVEMKDPRRWEKMRKFGKWKYIFLIGTLGYGGIMFVVSLLVNGFYLSLKDDMRAILLVVNFILWGLGGTLFGFLTWWFNERAYKKAMKMKE